jgi:hypothetical protein
MGLLLSAGERQYGCISLLFLIFIGPRAELMRLGDIGIPRILSQICFCEGPTEH